MMAVNGANSPQQERQQAFVAFVRTHENDLLGFVRSRVGPQHSAQEIVQATFLRAWIDSSFDPRHPYARAWAFTTARRLIFDCRRAKDSNSISLDDLSARLDREGSRGSRSAVTADQKARDPLAAMIEAEMNHRLDIALSMLSDDDRDVLERYYLRGEGTQYEIAREIGISLAAFNSRLNRARKELKRLILKLREHDGESHNGHDFRNG
jgi:RNA polymerase sigma-70 factor (ECF subfamily)